MSQLSKSNHRVRGASLGAMLFWAIGIAIAALIVMKVVPTLNEYFTIQKAVNKIALEASTPVEARNAFERQKQIDYSITSISGQDLLVAKENDKLVVSFAYDKEIELVSPVYLLIKYQGRSK
ncbi:MAG: DUF4845 domain-containing protein [Pseudomonadota bacterium]